MANRVLAALRRMCAWAVERDVIKASPCDAVKTPSVPRSRDRVLPDDELSLVWKACDAIGWPFGPLVQLLVLTGQRREEVAAMRWS
jgi:integrase